MRTFSFTFHTIILIALLPIFFLIFVCMLVLGLFDMILSVPSDIIVKYAKWVRGKFKV